MPILLAVQGGEGGGSRGEYVAAHTLPAAGMHSCLGLPLPLSSLAAAHLLPLLFAQTTSPAPPLPAPPLTCTSSLSSPLWIAGCGSPVLCMWRARVPSAGHSGRPRLLTAVAPQPHRQQCSWCRTQHVSASSCQRSSSNGASGPAAAAAAAACWQQGGAEAAAAAAGRG